MRPGPLPALFTSLVVVACANTIDVREPFPDPVIESLPLRVGVHYTTEFANYSYTDAQTGAGSWTLRLGGANVSVFDRVFVRLFTATSRVAAVPTGSSSDVDFDAFVEPVVTNVEFSLPLQSHTDQYAVWLRYKLNVYDRTGQLLHEWPVSAYGQSEDRGLSGARSMTRAVVLALRDAEATIATQFAQEPKIREALLHPKEIAHAGAQ